MIRKNLFNITIAGLSALLFMACEYDVDAPVIKTLSSAENSNITNKYAPISFKATDNKMGVYPGTLKILINGTDATDLAAMKSNIITIQPTEVAPLPSGNFTISITLSDIIENEATTSFSYIGTYISDGLQVFAKSEKTPDASSPSTKYTVHSENKDNIALYEWDFDNDGQFDHSDIVTGDVVHAGYSRDSTLRVTDISGDTTTISITTK